MIKCHICNQEFKDIQEYKNHLPKEFKSHQIEGINILINKKPSFDFFKQKHLGMSLTIKRS